MTWKANRLALRQGSLFPLCASTVAGVVIITPVLVVLWRSLTSGKLGFTVGLNATNYLRVFADKDIWPMLSNSLVYAGGSAPDCSGCRACRGSRQRSQVSHG